MRESGREKARPGPRLRRPVEPGQCNGSAESNLISSRCFPLCILLGVRSECLLVWLCVCLCVCVCVRLSVCT